MSENAATLDTRLSRTREEMVELRADVKSNIKATEKLEEALTAGLKRSTQQHEAQNLEIADVKSTVHTVRHDVKELKDTLNVYVLAKVAEQETEAAIKLEVAKAAAIEKIRSAEFRKRLLLIGGPTGLTIIGAITAAIKTGWFG